MRPTGPGAPCWECGKAIPAGKRRHTRCCREACSGRAYRRANREKRAAYYRAKRHAPVVYFGVGDFEAIKIGTTTHLRHRLEELGCALLAYEPGSLREETRMHGRFAHAQFDSQLSRASEWHRPTPDLLIYIASLQRAYGDDWTARGYEWTPVDAPALHPSLLAMVA